VPIILFGKDYWNKVFHPEVLVEEGAVSEEDLRYFNYVDDVQDAWQIIKDFYPNEVPKPI